MPTASVDILSFVAVPHWQRSYAGGFDFNWNVRARGFAPTFQVQSQEAEGADWINLLPGPVIVPFVAGVGPQQLSFQSTGHFRLLVLTPDGTVVATSRPIDARASLGRTDWLRYREMLRRERLELQKLTGLPGFLLRRIVYGTLCPTCTSPVTGEVTVSDCPDCYGVGYVGGYYPAFPVFASWDDPPGGGGDTTTTDDKGASEGKRTRAQLMPFPQAKFEDVLVDRGTGERYQVSGQGDQPAVAAVSFRSAPIKQILALCRLAPSDPAYGVPVPGL